MGEFSIFHWLVVLAVILIFFGGKRIPKLRRGLAKAFAVSKMVWPAHRQHLRHRHRRRRPRSQRKRKNKARTERFREVLDWAARVAALLFLPVQRWGRR